MLSNQILHKTVQDIKRISGLECAVWDMRGICLVMTNEKMIGYEKEVADIRNINITDQQKTKFTDDFGMFLVEDEEEPAYILGLSGR